MIFILVIIAVILLVMYPKECGYEIGGELKECNCLGYVREGKVDLCYGFCRDCVCSELVDGNRTVMDCVG